MSRLEIRDGTGGGRKGEGSIGVATESWWCGGREADGLCVEGPEEGKGTLAWRSIGVADEEEGDAEVMWMGVARAMVMVMAMARTRAGVPRTPWGSSGAWQLQRLVVT